MEVSFTVEVLPREAQVQSEGVAVAIHVFMGLSVAERAGDPAPNYPSSRLRDGSGRAQVIGVDVVDFAVGIHGCDRQCAKADDVLLYSAVSLVFADQAVVRALNETALFEVVGGLCGLAEVVFSFGLFVGRGLLGVVGLLLERCCLVFFIGGCGFSGGFFGGGVVGRCAGLVRFGLSDVGRIGCVVGPVLQVAGNSFAEFGEAPVHPVQQALPEVSG